MRLLFVLCDDCVKVISMFCCCSHCVDEAAGRSELVPLLLLVL